MHCFVALCMPSHVDRVLIYLQSFDDFHLTGSIRNSTLLIHVMTLECPNNG